MADYRPEPRPKTPLDNPKLKMLAPNSKGKTANLVWGLVENNPRLTVYTNDPDDDKPIHAKLDAPTLFAIFQMLRNAIASKQACKDKVDCMGYTFPGGKRSEKPTTLSSVIVGRDEGGLVWICVSAYQRQNIQFKFTNPDFHHFIHGDGTRFSLPEVSTLMASAYLNLLENMYSHMLVSSYHHVVRDMKGNTDQGGKSGGYNRNSGGGASSGGNYQKKESSVDTDSSFGDEDTPW